MDLVVSLGITSLLLGVSVLTLRGTFTDLRSSAQSVTAEIRKARMYAVTRGAHYRMSLAGDWYKTERLQDNNNDGIWQVDTSYPAAPQQNLPGGISMTANTGNTSSGTPVIEFDSRGMVVPQSGSTVPNLMTITVVGQPGDTMIGTLYVYVWPSGQVELLTSNEVHP